MERSEASLRAKFEHLPDIFDGHVLEVGDIQGYGHQCRSIALCHENRYAESAVRSRSHTFERSFKRVSFHHWFYTRHTAVENHERWTIFKLWHFED